MCLVRAKGVQCKQVVLVLGVLAGVICSACAVEEAPAIIGVANGPPSCADSDYRTDLLLVRINIGDILMPGQTTAESVLAAASSPEVISQIQTIVDDFFAQYPGDYSCITSDGAQLAFSEESIREEIGALFGFSEGEGW